MKDLKPTVLHEAIIIINTDIWREYVGDEHDEAKQATLLAMAIDFEEQSSVLEMLSPYCPETTAMLNHFYAQNVEHALLLVLNTHPDEYQQALEIIYKCNPKTYQLLRHLFSLATVVREISGNLDKPNQLYH